MLRSVPVPSPTSDEQLALFFRHVEDVKGWIAHGDYLNGSEEKDAELIVAAADQLRFLTALVRDLSADGALAQYQAGYKKGRKVGFREGQIDITNKF